MTKNETLSAKIGELSEKIALQTSEYDSKIDEIMKAKKTEVGELKDRVSGQEAAVLDLEMQVRDAEARSTSLQAELRSEADLASTKLDKLSAENESLRRSKYELETSVKNVGSERDHIVHLNEDLSIRIVEFEVQVKEMRSQYESLQVSRFGFHSARNHISNHSSKDDLHKISLNTSGDKKGREFLMLQWVINLLSALSRRILYQSDNVAFLAANFLILCAKHKFSQSCAKLAAI